MIPFGWSAGDLAFAIGFIVKTGTALKDHGGAADDFQTKVKFLRGVEATLRDLEFFTRHFAGTAYLDSINDEAVAIKAAVDSFVAKLQSFESTIGVNRQVTNFLRRNYHKAKWVHYASDRCSELQAAVQLPLTAINTHLNLQIMSLLMTIKRDLPDQIVGKLNTSLQNHLQSCSNAMTISLNARQDVRQEEIINAMKSLKLASSAPVLSLMAPTDAITGLGVTIANHQVALADSQLKLDEAIRAIQTQSLQVHNLVDLSLQARQSEHMVSSQHRQLGEVLEALRQEVFAIVAIFAVKSRLLLIQIISILAPILGPLLRQLASNARRIPLLLTGGDKIFFLDALDRIKVLPFCYFQDWELVEAFIRSSFKGLLGHQQILEKQFRLCLSSGIEVDSHTWHTRVRPGTHVAMSIAQDIAEDDLPYCPRCWNELRPRDGSPIAFCAHCGLTHVNYHDNLDLLLEKLWVPIILPNMSIQFPDGVSTSSLDFPLEMGGKSIMDIDTESIIEMMSSFRASTESRDSLEKLKRVHAEPSRELLTQAERFSKLLDSVADEIATKSLKKRGGQIIRLGGSLARFRSMALEEKITCDLLSLRDFKVLLQRILVLVRRGPKPGVDVDSDWEDAIAALKVSFNRKWWNLINDAVGQDPPA